MIPKVIHIISNSEVCAENFSSNEWSDLKNNYLVGDFIMSCCSAPAIPKTSENGLQFFAHLSDACANAPETIWHKKAKDMVHDYCIDRNIFCKLEEPNIKHKCKADVYIEYNARKIVIEIQRSYQHRDKFFERQKRYKDSGIECFWLVRQEVYRTFVSTESKHRLRTEYGGKLPEKMPICNPGLPIVFLVLEPEIGIRGGGLFKSSFEAWLDSIFKRTFIFDGFIWKISN